MDMCLLVLLCKYESMEWLEHMLDVCLNFYETANLFSKVVFKTL